MGNGATTRTVGLLERSAELDALDGHQAVVREQGRGRLRPPRRRGRCRQDGAASRRWRASGRATPRVLWGGCDSLFTPRPLAPLARRRDVLGGEVGGAWSTPARAHALTAALTRAIVAGHTLCGARGPALGRRGDARRPGGCSSAASRRVPPCPRQLPRRRARSAPPAAVVLGELASRAAARMGSRPSRREAGGRLVERHGGTRELHRRPAAIRSSSSRCWPQQRRGSGHGPRRRARARRTAQPAGADTARRGGGRSERRRGLAAAELAEPSVVYLDERLTSGMLTAERDARAVSARVARQAVRSRRARPPVSRCTAGRSRRSPNHEAPGSRPPRPPRGGRRRHGCRARPGRPPPRRPPSLGAYREAAAQFVRALRFGERVCRRQSVPSSWSAAPTRVTSPTSTDEGIAALEEALEVQGGRSATRPRRETRCACCRSFSVSGSNAGVGARGPRCGHAPRGASTRTELAMAYAGLVDLRCRGARRRDRRGQPRDRACRAPGDTEIAVYALATASAS